MSHALPQNTSAATPGLKLTPEVWAAIRPHIEDALALDEDLRCEFVERNIAEPDLRQTVLQLLAFEGKAGKFFSIDCWSADLALPKRSEVFGNFRACAELGRGGMGTVYLAERADGLYQQQVAIKVLQETAHVPQLADRFLRERQILARLRHPGIARLLDGGMTSDQRPYLVMEYVQGIPIDAYCNEKALDIDARLRLSLRVAEAVQSAHQQFVLHLDLKPANILVTDDGTPRLLDFGIGRFLTETENIAKQSEATLKLLTPRYASPEQASGGELGIPSDVFSLATIVYKLLTDHLPYALEGKAPLEVMRILRDVQAMPPSEAAPEVRQQKIRGDIDLILLKALRKEPERRYPTVAAFAQDIERHLRSEPVEAHADSFSYRFAKFLRRHRAGAITTIAAFALLVVGITAIVRQTVIARHERTTAERRLADMRGLAHSYVFDLDPQLEQIPGTVQVRHFVLEQAQKYLESMSREVLNDDDLTKETAQGYGRIGQVYATPGMPSMSDYTAAESAMLKAIALQESVVKRQPQDMDTRGHLLELIRHRAEIIAGRGDLPLAQSILIDEWTTALPIYNGGAETPFYNATPTIAQSIASNYVGQGDGWDLADPLAATPWLDRAQHAMDDIAQKFPRSAASSNVHSHLETIFADRAFVLIRTGHVAEARPLLLRALELTTNGTQTIFQQQNARIYRTLYADYLLQTGDVSAARDLLPQLLADPAIASSGHITTLEEAGTRILAGRIELANAHSPAAVSRGLHRIRVGLSSLDALYTASPQDADVSAAAAWQSYRVAESLAVPANTRRDRYKMAAAVAETHAAAFPGVLSAEILIARCELGLGSVARDAETRHAHGRAAESHIREVLAIRPEQPEASTLLQRALQLEIH